MRQARETAEGRRRITAAADSETEKRMQCQCIWQCNSLSHWQCNWHWHCHWCAPPTAPARLASLLSDVVFKVSGCRPEALGIAGT